MTDKAIQIKKIHKYYGRVHALQGLDLEVNPGEIFGFLGPNGAGKTTAIRCMLDLIRPNSGSIRILGLDPQMDAKAVKAKVGYLPGDLKLDGDFTGRQFLKHIRQIRGNARPWANLLALAQRLDLDLDRKIKTLSQGNKQKVGLLQCFISEVPLFLLDEPTLGLDPLMQMEVLRIVREERERGTTVFFSSHILSEVQKVADRVGIIRKGKLVEIAQMDDLINHALSRLTIQFSEPVPMAGFDNLPRVKVMHVNDDQHSYTLEVMGEMDRLIKALSAYPVQDLSVQKPSLEEVFLNYYRNEGEEE